VCVEASLNPWDEGDLVMVNDLSGMLLEMFIKEIGCSFLFLMCLCPVLG
jgi:hypothetical protein